MTSKIQEGLKRADLLAIASQDTPLLKGPTSTNGPEFHGPCPFCGGKDRFWVCPEHPAGKGMWFCRHCNAKGGDAVAYLRQRDGASFKEALLKLGIETETNGHRPPVASRKEPRYQDVESYDYRDREGKLLFQVVRQERTVDGERQKKFVQRRPDGKGGWIWKTAGIEKVLYRLPEVIEGVKAGDTIYIVEGEKSADRLVQLGFRATTNPVGAGKWRDSYNAGLKDADVVILADMDDPGHNHAQQVAASLHKEAKRLRVALSLPGLEHQATGGPDIVDWLEGNSVSAFTDLIGTLPPYEPPPVEPEDKAAEEKEEESIPLTDLGNARRLARLCGEDLRYCPQMGWLVWDGRRWRVESSRDPIRVQQKARLVPPAIMQEAFDMAGEDLDRQKAVLKWVFTTQSQTRFQAMISLAKSEPGMPISVHKLDTHHHLINCRNGTLDLKIGTLRPHQREDLITALAPVDYDPAARCPRWLAFLDRIMAGNQDLIAFLQRAVGYALTGETREQKFFLAYGVGANGKSTFVETIRAALGGDYSKQVNFGALMRGASESEQRSTLVRLKGARFVTAIEAREGGSLNEVVVKQLTGGDTVVARQLYQEEFEFQPELKLFLASNHLPSVNADDHAMWRRMEMIPFTVTLPEEEWDLMLNQKLLTELDGIFAWAVKGAIAWYQDGLGVPPKVQKASDDYRHEMDDISQFLEERCLITPTARVKMQDLYKGYVEWCRENEEKDRFILGKRAFNDRLRRKGFESVQSTGGYFYWLRIGLLEGGVQGDFLDDGPRPDDQEMLLDDFPKSNLSVKVDRVDNSGLFSKSPLVKEQNIKLMETTQPKSTYSTETKSDTDSRAWKPDESSSKSPFAGEREKVNEAFRKRREQEEAEKKKIA
jgi:putative DNA primase/helicase